MLLFAAPLIYYLCRFPEELLEIRKPPRSIDNPSVLHFIHGRDRVSVLFDKLREILPIPPLPVLMILPEPETVVGPGNRRSIIHPQGAHVIPLEDFGSRLEYNVYGFTDHFSSRRSEEHTSELQS